MKTVMITGGSEGIGFELARCFARDGWHLILVARNEVKLQEAEERLLHEFGIRAECISLDLSAGNAPSVLNDKVKKQKIDAFINNAGAGYTGRCIDQTAGSSEKMMQLNCTSVLILSNLMAKKMSLEGGGMILNVSSTGAFQPGPYIGAYYASKAFVLSYTRALHEEVWKYGIRVYCLCPGPVRTRFYTKSNAEVPVYAMRAERCAQYAYKHLHQKGCVIVPGVGNKILRCVPAGIKMKVVGRMKEKIVRKRYAAAG